MTEPTFRKGHRVQPLIEAEETYAAMEKAIDGAEEEVLMAYWSLAPNLDLVTDRAEDWEALLSRAVERGVRFRILLADFDPVFMPTHHRGAWRTYRRLMGLSDRTDSAGAAVQVMCSRNPARPGWPEWLAGNIAVQFMIGRLIKRLSASTAEGGGGADAARRAFGTAPGFWRHIARSGSRFVRRLPRPANLLPGTHHEKLCIVDRRIAFVGGLDIGERRYDTLRHDSETPWHDLACLLEGPAVALLTRHFVDRWNVELEDFRTFMDALPAFEEKAEIRPAVLRRMEDGAADAAGGGDGDHGGDVAVATSRSGGESPAALDVDRRISSISAAIEEIVGSARRFLYIETQYLRVRSVTDRLIQACRDNPELEVILLLPLAPERLNSNDGWSTPTRHGHWLQYRNLRRLREALGERFGVYTLVSRQRAEDDDQPEDTALGAKGVYVHAKTIIADDAMAMVGSANLNDRSLALDTEAAILWRQPGAVREFRQRLWRHHLGFLMPDGFDPHENSSLAIWNRAAAANRHAPMAERPGFAIAFEDDRARRNARRSLFVRSRYV